MTTDQTPHRAVLTVTAISRPDGGHYFDQADFTGHITEWVRAALKGKHAVNEVTIAPAVVPVPPPADRAALRDRIAAATVTPPPALTEAGRLRAQVEVLQRDAARDQGLAKVGARCMRDGHQGLIEEGRAVIEGWRFALSTALGLGTGAPWEAIHERVKELRRMAAEEQPALCVECGHPKAVHRDGDDPVTPGECSACPEDDARHDHRPAVGEQPETQEEQHLGGRANAEDCPACKAERRNLPYPFLCPGPDVP